MTTCSNVTQAKLLIYASA